MTCLHWRAPESNHHFRSSLFFSFIWQRCYLPACLSLLRLFRVRWTLRSLVLHWWITVVWFLTTLFISVFLLYLPFWMLTDSCLLSWTSVPPQPVWRRQRQLRQLPWPGGLPGEATQPQVRLYVWPLSRYEVGVILSDGEKLDLTC